MDKAVPTEVQAPHRPKFATKRRPPKRRIVSSPPAAMPNKRTKRSLDDSVLAEPLPSEDITAGMLFNMMNFWLFL